MIRASSKSQTLEMDCALSEKNELQSRWLQLSSKKLRFSHEGFENDSSDT